MDFSIALYDALIAVSVPADKARAVVTALERDMTQELATKSDLAHLRELLNAKLDAQANSLLIRLSAVLVTVVGVATAILKYH
jgi:hypothetical protein